MTPLSNPLRISLALALIASVNAHGYIGKPAAQYKDEWTKTSFNALITESVNPAFQGKKWNDNAVANANTFAQAFAQAGYKSLREMLDAAVPDCGNSRVDIEPVDVSGMSTMEFRNDQDREGLVNSHRGPCEVWIDDTKILHEDDCRAKYESYPAVLPVDYSVCKGKCVLKFYWLALHEPQWQIYKQCVPINNPNGNGPSEPTPTPTPAPTPTPTATLQPTAVPSPHPYPVPSPAPSDNMDVDDEYEDVIECDDDDKKKDDTNTDDSDEYEDVIECDDDDKIANDSDKDKDKGNHNNNNDDKIRPDQGPDQYRSGEHRQYNLRHGQTDTHSERATGTSFDFSELSA